MKKQLTAIIEREGDGYVSLCPELDIASQGETILINEEIDIDDYRILPESH